MLIRITIIATVPDLEATAKKIDHEIQAALERLKDMVGLGEWGTTIGKEEA